MAYYPICLFQEFIDISEGEGWVEGRSSIMALQELIQGRCEVCHGFKVKKYGLRQYTTVEHFNA
jgi:hypothetical protein